MTNKLDAARNLDAVRKDELIGKLTALFQQKMPKAQALLLTKFVNQYLAYTAIEDLLAKDIGDLYGAIVSIWHFLYQRKPNKVKLSIYNPSLEEHGWESTHTIIEVSQDDMPFIVDSLQMEINRLGFTVHFMIHVGGMKFIRDQAGKIVDILPFDSASSEKVRPGAPIYIEINRETDPAVLADLKENLLRVLNDVRLAVTDWSTMLAKLKVLTTLETEHLKVNPSDLAEAIDFLHWLEKGNFTFLGCRDYELVGQGANRELRVIKGSGLGVLREEEQVAYRARSFSAMPLEVQRLVLSPDQFLIITKTGTISTVHRPVYTDYIGVKLFDKKGNVVGERRFIGLYTSAAYNSSPRYIPFLRRKVQTVLQKTLLLTNGHAGKALLNVMETLPRDDLFQATVEELHDLSMGILQMQERQKIRLFARKDLYGRFISCLVYVPRDRFNTTLREQIEQTLLHAFNGTSTNYSTRFSESRLVCTHIVIRVNPKEEYDFDIKAIEQRIIDIARTWQDDFKRELIEQDGEEAGNRLFYRYHRATPAGYIEAFSSRTAVFDVAHIESITDEKSLSMSLSRPVDEGENILRLKLYQRDTTVVLSDVLPILENMGLRVIGERPYRFRFSSTECAWINDFTLQYATENDVGFDTDDFAIEKIRNVFQEAFKMIWFSHVENDGFNRLVLGAGIAWQEVCILRAYAKYIRQLGFIYSQHLIEKTLTLYPKITMLLIQLFDLRFNPKQQEASKTDIDKVRAALQKMIDSVASLHEDRILSRYYELIMATTRTNYYQQTGQIKSYISFKLDPAKISEIPLPRPKYEIFVYAPRFEGVHLRGAKVARGGLRWSDRREDFRTEVLGLMKAQQVKNALIVPLGAKGGFVAKQLPVQGSREKIMQEGIYCYQNFIRGLLDITDNLKDGKVIKPKNMVAYDEDDTYLVVAADKGTATFSDIANEIAEEYNFWLADAFASGGRTGYDHKKMAITARGAWESVKHHFRTLNINTQTTPFTVVGIGDMGGDVFGNGMLLSPQIKLVAAFNHQNIFIDPNPDPATSFAERQRLFDARGGWTEYDKSLISEGGGVFSRNAKLIRLTPQIKQVLDVEKDTMVPTDLMQAILKAPVDLFWNGGIGTFMKGSMEQDADVGDRANDLIRINGNQLRVRVVGEGGNLGLTQLARIEYALKGGLVNTDFIDNSAGVDCSDHEVNIKILLDSMVRNGDMTQKQRNRLLADMTEDVAKLVLAHNYRQCQSISAITAHSKRGFTTLVRYMQAQEAAGKLDRELEFLPTDSTLAERKVNAIGFTRPEMAVLLAYSKNITKQDILASDVPEDPQIAQIVADSFPSRLCKQYLEQMSHHTLRREMIATRLSNLITDDLGISFVHQLHDESGASILAISRAYVTAHDVFNITALCQQVGTLDYQVDAAIQTKILVSLSQLTRRATRWFLRIKSKTAEVPDVTAQFRASITKLIEQLPNMVLGQEKAYLEKIVNYYKDAGINEQMATQFANIKLMFTALDIIDGAHECGVDVEAFGYCYFAIGDKLELSWISQQIIDHQVDDYWTAIARTALRDDIDLQRRGLTLSVLKTSLETSDLSERLAKWEAEHARLIERWHIVLSEIRSVTIDLTRLSVVVRVLMDLSQIGFHAIMAEEEGGAS